MVLSCHSDILFHTFLTLLDTFLISFLLAFLIMLLIYIFMGSIKCFNFTVQKSEILLFKLRATVFEYLLEYIEGLTRPIIEVTFRLDKQPINLLNLLLLLHNIPHIIAKRTLITSCNNILHNPILLIANKRPLLPLATQIRPHIDRVMREGVYNLG